MQDLTKELNFAIELAALGGKEIQKVLSSHRNSDAIQRRWPTKRHTEVKTEIDKTVDDIPTGGIQSFFPEDAIYSEESEFREGTSGRTWVNDSIDGTLNLQGPLYGMFGVCPSLTIDNIPIVGVVRARVSNSRNRELGQCLKSRALAHRFR